MRDEITVKWGDSYIEVKGGNLTVKHKGNAVMQASIGGTTPKEAFCDKIENFELLSFKVYMKVEPSLLLKHNPTGYTWRIEPVVNKETIEKFILFRDIMEQHGCFGNKKRTEAFLESYSSWTAKEKKYLNEILQNGETLMATTSGTMNGKTWLLACTTKRVILIDCGLVYRIRHSEIMLDKINSISFSNGMMYGEICIEDGASTRTIKSVNKKATQPFVDAVHNAMENMKSTSDNKVNTAATVSVADELLKYKELLDEGIITTEEFEKLKAKAIG